MLICAACLFVVALADQNADLFDQFDRNADGRIEGAELPPAGGPVRSILDSRDANQDGVITRAEFGVIAAKPAGPAPKAPATEATAAPQGPTEPDSLEQQRNALFDVLDENGDGVVTRDEVPAAMKTRVERIFQRSGKDKLTIADFAVPKQQTFFNLLDANGDGLVSRTEIEKAANDPMALRLSGLQTKPLFEAMKTSEFDTFTEAELNALLIPVLRRQMLEQGLADTFARLDVNGDGVATVAEAPPTLREGLERMLERLERPLDSKLTFAEFERLARASQESLNPLPPQRLSKVPAAFTVLDADRSGTITPDELVDVVDRLGRLDADRDNALSLAEFMGALPGQEVVAPKATTEPRPAGRQPISKTSLQEAEAFASRFFERFDRDANGTLTSAEVPSFSARFGKFDVNGDGALGRAEMIEAILQAGRK